MKDSVEDIAAILNLHTDSIIFTNFFSEEDSKADFEFTPDTISNVTKMPGASNVTYKVDFKVNGNSHSIIYRKFTNKLVDFRIENLIFQTLSDNKEGPYCFYQCNKYRIEEYIPSRTISIFELRNLNFMKEITSHFASFHCNNRIQEGVTSLIESQKTCLELFLENWWKQIKDKIKDIRNALKRDDYSTIFEDFVSEYYREGFEDYWRSLLPQCDDKIVAHTDAQETNILLLKAKPLKTATIKCMLIDYEYAGIVERSWDLANYYIETMLSNCEYDEYPWLQIYPENRMSPIELEQLVDYYIQAIIDLDGPTINRDEFLKEVKSMVVLINYYWGAWAMASLEMDTINDDDLYFEAAKIRLQLIDIAKENLS
ncbi:unnamed protein product [Moneuplotes crassus]|uniref:Choline kinase n=1 Tax=Euplotes crassus TaxID=5936 RepID=A0AAD1XIQ6_EUPCR|nr:unnamed protein product [Moneuplotes crassus]